MPCTNCGHENIEGSKYCNQCGLPLNRTSDRNKKISLGGYENFTHPHVKNVKYRDSNQVEESSMENILVRSSKDYADEIMDRDQSRAKKKRRRSPFLKMTLVVILALFVFVGYNAIQYAMNSQEQRVTQAQLMAKQQEEAEVLQRLENYREKFNAVVTSYEAQGELIKENTDKVTTLRINRFAKNLGLGTLFNKAVNAVFDVSQVNELKITSETLNILVGELINPPETFATKFKSLQDLQNLENNITQKMVGELSSDTKKELLKLHEEYNMLLTNIKR